MNKIQELMQQELSRKEFLRYIGLAFLSLIGVAAMIQNLTNSLSHSGKNATQSGGYGKSAYGR